MKIHLFIIIFTFFFVSCEQKKSKNMVKNISIINIAFNDYNPSEHKCFISLTIENNINPIQEQLKISDDGTLSFNFINTKKRELIFNYENREFSVLISPNEEINAEMKISELVDWNSNFDSFKVNSGENNETNNLLIEYTSLIDKIIASKPVSFTNKNDYKENKITGMHKQLNEFDIFLKNEKIKNKEFINWGKTQIVCNAGIDLCFYSVVGKNNNKINDESDYFDFIDEINLNINDNRIDYQVYLKYVKKLSTTFEIISNVSNKYSNEREVYKAEKNANFPILFDIIKKRPKNNEKELLMGFIFENGQIKPLSYLDSLKYYSKYKNDSKVNFNKNEKSNIITLLKNYDIPNQEKEELLNIYKNTEGKVVFHDFWFASCAPCMKELPNYNQLISENINNDVEFVFYGVYMKKDEWNKNIEKFKLKGQHHLLSKNQLAFFEKHFDIKGFPHHHLINSSGKIGDKIMSRVNPTNFSEINKIINEHRLKINGN
jgi:thiol-disulfide isomerase/thioredoxin